MKALVILPPPVGNGGRQAVLDALRRQFGAVAIEYAVYETRDGDLVADIVRRRLREGWDRVVVAGGDGTVSAVGDGPLGTTSTSTAWTCRTFATGSGRTPMDR